MHYNLPVNSYVLAVIGILCASSTLSAKALKAPPGLVYLPGWRAP